MLFSVINALGQVLNGKYQLSFTRAAFAESMLAVTKFVIWFILCFLYDCEINLVIKALIQSFIHSFIHSFNQSFIHLFIHSFTHSFIHSFNHSFVQEETTRGRFGKRCSWIMVQIY